MPDDRTSGERQPRRWPRRLAFVALAGVVALVVAYGLREVWIAPLANRLLARYRERLGAEITVARARGGLWNEIVLEGVTWKSATPPLLAVADARVELEYSLRALLEGELPRRVAVVARGVEIALEASERESERKLELPRLEQVELELTDVRVQVPALERGPFELGELRAMGALLGDTVRIDSLEAVAEPNRIALAGVTFRTDVATARDLVRSARGELRALLPEAGVLADVLPRDVPLRSAALLLRLGDARATLEGSAVLEGGTLEVARGALVWPEGAGFDAIELDLGLRAALDDLAPLSALAGRPIAGSWHGGIDVTGPLSGLHGRFAGRGADLRVAGLALDSLEIDVVTDGERATFEHFAAQGPELEAFVRGAVVLSPLELDDVAIDLVAGQLALGELVPFPIEELTVHARLSGPPSAPSGRFEAGATVALVGGVRVEDAEVRGELVGDRVEVHELRLTSQESRVEAAGRIARDPARPEGWNAELDSLALERRGVRVELEKGGRIAFAPGRVVVEGVELVSRAEDGAGVGRASIALSYEDHVLRGTTTFTSYDAGPLLAPVLPSGWRAGTLHGNIQGELGGAAPALELELALGGWAFRADMPSAGGTVRGGLRGERFVLDLVDLELGDRSGRLRGRASVPFDPARPRELAAGPLEASLAVEAVDPVRALRRLGIDPRVRASGPLRAWLDLGGTLEAPTGRVELQAEDLLLGRGAAELACDAEAEVTLGQRVALERAVLSTSMGSIGLVGTLDVPLRPAEWAADPRALMEAPLELALDVELSDVGWVAALTREVRRVSGAISGSIQLTGTALEPVLGGGLAWRDGEMRLVDLETSMRSVSAEIGFDDDVVVIERLHAEVGGAPVEVRGTLEPFGPFRRMDLEVSGKSVLLARSAKLRVRADAELVVKGTPGQVNIGGEVALTEGLFIGEISPLEELLRVGRRDREPKRTGSFQLFPNDPLASAELDVRVGGKPFEYRTNLVRAELRPEIFLRGTGAFPIIEGAIYLEEGSLTLPSGEMELVSGVLQYGVAGAMRPEITVTAETSVQLYDVRAEATGPFDELEITLSSTPPLPDDDLWVLVLTGQVPTNSWQDSSSQAMEALAVFLARDTLVRWFSDGPGEGGGVFDRFEIDIGAQTSQTGQTTGRVLFYLRPKSRRSGRATYLSAEIDHYDRVNYALGIVFRPR